MALITSSVVDSVLHLTFEDASSRNSFSVRAARELRAELSRAKFKALVFRAKGRVFCSGGNLSDYAGMTDAASGIAVNREITAALGELEKLNVPTACVVEGDSFGGGLELMAAFDFVYAVPHAYFGFWQRKIGLTFGWGGGQRLERRVGASRLRSLALSAATIGAQEARACGLVDHIGDHAERDLKRLMTLPSSPVGPIKTESISNEASTFEKLWWNDEHRGVLEARKTAPASRS